MKKIALLLAFLLVFAGAAMAETTEERYYALDSLRASAERMGVTGMSLTLDATGSAVLHEGEYDYNGSYAKTAEGYSFAFVPFEGYTIEFDAALTDGMLVCRNMDGVSGTDYIFRTPENGVAGEYPLSDLIMPAASVGYTGPEFHAILNADGTCELVGFEGTYTETETGVSATISDGTNTIGCTGVMAGEGLVFIDFLGSNADWVFVPAEKPVVVTAEEALAAESKIIYADIAIEGYDSVITIQLCPDEAPETVENFVSLAKDGFYDGLTFHRIMSGFMMQGGDPLGNGTGGSSKNIKGEFTSNGVMNPLSHTRGAVSMARSSDMNSASSQFFIVHEDSTFLDGNYAVFGYVISGIEVVDDVCTKAQPTDSNGSIAKDAQPVMKSVVIREA